MSDLQTLLTALDSVNREADRIAGQLSQQAHRLGQAASRAALSIHSSSQPGGQQVVNALTSAQTAVTTAANYLRQASLAGQRFVVDRSASQRPDSGPSAETGGVAGLTSEEASSLRDYTDDGYLDMNEELRGLRAMTSTTARKAETLSAALAKLPDAPGTTFRGTTLSAAQIQSYAPGATRPEPGFTSSSSDPTRSFPGNTLFLLVGQHGKSVDQFSRHDEAEVLFDKGTRFHVTSNFFDQRLGKQVIIMMEVSDE